MDEQTKDLRKQIQQKAYEYLARREYSMLELYNRLITFYKKKFSESEMEQCSSLISDVLDELQLANAVSNERYANMIVREKVRQYRGPRLIHQALTQRGITNQLWLDAWQPYSESEGEICRQALKKWLGRREVSNLASQKDREKAIRFLTQRGFYFRTIQAVLNQEK